ncbi:MAG: hypothetical protein NTW28_38140 [Candidatus Solibacter sp.]|nr:hypothetical protein [Candidatus Solibacter sp.]
MEVLTVAAVRALMRFKTVSFSMGLLLTVLPGLVQAQGRVVGDGWAERLVVVVPMTGKGTYDDPRRPDLGTLEAKDTALTGWRYELSDDGKNAIVLLSGAHLGQARAVTAKASLAHATVYERGRHSKEEIETEMRKFRKDFSLERLVGIPTLAPAVAK